MEIDKVKVSKKSLDYFNSKFGIWDEPTFNESFNKMDGRPSQKEWSLMLRVSNAKFGISRKRITMKMIKEYTGE